MVDIIDEIKEDMKREKYETLWKSYGKFIIGCAVLAVLGTATGVYYKKYMQQARESQGDILYSAKLEIEQGNYQAAGDMLSKVVENGSNEASAIALLNKAATLINEGKEAEAVSIYQNLAGDSSAPVEFQQLAKLLFFYHDNVDVNQLIEEIKQVNIDDNPWKYSISELLAMKYLEAGNKKPAIDLFTELVLDPKTPVNMKKRAGEMLDAISDGKKEDDNKNNS